MNAERLEVGNIYCRTDKYSHIKYEFFITKVEVSSQTFWFVRNDGYCDEYSFSTIDEFTYLGKSKTNINELFKVGEISSNTAENKEKVIKLSDLEIEEFNPLNAGRLYNGIKTRIKITHAPTKISIECDGSKSQWVNRQDCFNRVMKILIKKGWRIEVQDE